MALVLKIKEIFIESGTASTIYGIPKLVISKRIYQKILWISFLIVSTCFSCWFITDSLLNYFDYKVVTIVKNVYEQPTEFPTVTLCSYKSKYFNNKTLKSILTECRFGYDYSCQKNPDNYFESFYSSYGLCYRFNSGKNLTNHTIPIYKSNIGGIDDSFALNLGKFTDLIIWIHNRSSMPKINRNVNHYSNRLFISPNTYTQISISKIIDQSLSEPYNMCLNDVNDFIHNKTIINFIRSKNEAYTQEKCLDLCFGLNFLNKNPCNCTSSSVDKVFGDCMDDLNIKNNVSFFCSVKYMQDFYTESVVDKCVDYCPLECESISYNFELSPFVFYDSTRVKIYFRSLKYTLITQEPKMLPMDLVSNIGGTFGLFIGVSFVTLIEFLEIIIELTLCLLSNKQKT